MPKKSKKNISEDKDKLNRLINLRIFGFSVDSLAYLFNVKRCTIIYHFNKYGINLGNVRSSKQSEIYDIPRIVSGLIPPSITDVWMDIDGERINQGRSYQEYLDIERRNKSLIR